MIHAIHSLETLLTADVDFLLMNTLEAEWIRSYVLRIRIILVRKLQN